MITTAYPETISSDGRQAVGHLRANHDTATNGTVTNGTGKGDERPLRLRDWLAMAALVLAVLGCICFASLQPRHRAGETLGIVIFGGSPDAALALVAAAGGLVLRNGELAGSVIARAPDDGFIDRLRLAGADLIYRIDRGATCAGVR